MLLRAIAVRLGCVVLSADVAVVMAPEALLYSVGAVVELALVYLTVLCHSSVDDCVGYFWIFEFNNDRGCAFEGGFLP